MLSIDQIKQINLIDFLHRHYDVSFKLQSGQHVCLSPLSDEKDPSFFVRQRDDIWVFKDFSSGSSGSIIDFVMHKHSLSTVSESLDYIRALLPDTSSVVKPKHATSSPAGRPQGYNLEKLYDSMRRNDISPCCDYLSRRGISSEVIDTLVSKQLIVHNRYRSVSWCTFVVKDSRGNLRCLDNHQIDGDDKFVLGRKRCFSLDWSSLPTSEHVFVSEGIIDYLSIKTLEGLSFAGLALLGNVISFDPSLFDSARIILSTLDSDDGGISAFLDLQEQFPDRLVSPLDMGDCKDPNEYLNAVASGKEVTKLMTRDKLKLYRDYIAASNKSEVALRWGINRSYMYQVVKECEAFIEDGFSSRRPGRKPAGKPTTLEEAQARIAQLEEEKLYEEKEKQLHYARNAFLQIRLKYAEQEVAELEEQTKPPSKKKKGGPKKQVKKKKKKR